MSSQVAYHDQPWQQPYAPYDSPMPVPPNFTQPGRAPLPPQYTPPTSTVSYDRPENATNYSTSTHSRDVDAEGLPQGSVYAQNKACFDNPLAHNASWSPTQADCDLRKLPKIDFALRVQSRLTRSAGKPFEPEPRSFQRSPRLSPSAERAFQPLLLESDGKSGLIGAGFKPSYFGPILASHDVSAADFARFLEDIFTAGKVSGAGQVVANVAPLTMHLGLTGYFVTRAIVRGMARRNEPLVIETIETWQERFFGPRGLDVYAVDKGERVTARHVGLNPEPLQFDVAGLVNRVAAQDKHKKGKKDGKREKVKDKDARPVLVIAPLKASGY